MSKKSPLVLQHLEKISWRILDQYPLVIKDMIRGRPGVYSLYTRDKLYYIGLAANLMGRLKAHLRDRHHEAWDRFSVYLTVQDEHIKEMESLLLRIVNPRGNRVSGKFAVSENLHSKLNQRMKDADADRRARLLGGRVARRRRRSKTARTKGTTVLQGVIERRINLRGWRRGWQYSATLRKDGKISYDGTLYDSPAAAGRAAVKGRCNGWAFWHYRDKTGEWVPLRQLWK